MKENYYEGRVKLINCWPNFYAAYLNHSRLLHICTKIKGDRIWEGGCRDKGALNKGVFCGWQWQTFPLAFEGRRDRMRNSDQTHH